MEPASFTVVLDPLPTTKKAAIMTNDTNRPPATPPVISPTNARQGSRGVPVVVVLVAGLILAAIVWLGVEMWGEHIDPDKSQTASPGPGPATNQVPGSSQPTIDNSTPPGAPTQTAPTDRSENNQRGINSTPDRPARDGVQN
jgi:hypothetical protein